MNQKNVEVVQDKDHVPPGLLSGVNYDRSVRSVRLVRRSN